MTAPSAARIRPRVRAGRRVARFRPAAALVAAAGLFVWGALAASPARAEPLAPRADDEVVEVLPGDAAQRARERRARTDRAPGRAPADAAAAVRSAARLLAEARATGDPRPAGLALAALAPFSDPASAPADALVLQATLRQHLHDFDGAAATLERLLARPADARHPQALLTLATIRRVQGRYAASDAACRRLADAAPAAPHGAACLAENAALRGETAAARAALERLLAAPDAPAATRAWLGTTLAELEQRAGHPDAAERRWRAVLALEDDLYARIAFADFLLDRARPADALAALAGAPRTDAVLLRLAIAGTRLGRAEGARDAAELRERLAQIDERPEAARSHGRERALFALEVDRDPRRALAWARDNATLQREPLDLLVLARAARASGDAAALEAARRLVDETGLRDRRIDAALG